MKILDKYMLNKDDSCYKFAVELSKQLDTTFAYIFDNKSTDFCPEFLAATYLTPEYRFLIKPDQKNVVKKFLEGIIKLLCVKNDCNSLF